MYNVAYSDFERVSVEKFLRADVSDASVAGVSGKINVKDTAAIVAAILGK